MACGAEVRGVVATAGERFLVLLADPAATQLRARLLVVLASGRARCHLAPPRRTRGGGEFGEPEDVASAFARALEQRLAGARLESIAAVSGERVVEARFRGSQGETALVAELFGADPNLVLVDESGIVRCARRKRGGSRPLTIGERYVAPIRRDAAAADSTADTAAPPPSDPVLAEFAARHPVSYAYAIEYEPLDLAAIAAARAAALKARLHAELARNAKLVAALERDLAAADEAPRRRELADLVAANFTRLRKGQSSLVADDLYRGGEVAIPLDPALAPKDNLAKLYRGVERLERGRPQIAARLEAARGHARDLAAALELTARGSNSTTELNDAAETVDRLLGARRPAPTGPSSRDTREGDRREPFRRFVLPSGSEVLVGRSDAGNDHLTHRIARSHDVWLHVHGFHGSHVVLRVERGKTASLPDLLAAAQLAVYFSKRRGAVGAEVVYTEKKYVRKGRGKAGLALIERHKSLRIDHDTALLASLLGKDAG